jgi:hypothetical protein
VLEGVAAMPCCAVLLHLASMWLRVVRGVTPAVWCQFWKNTALERVQATVQQLELQEQAALQQLGGMVVLGEHHRGCLHAAATCKPATICKSSLTEIRFIIVYSGMCCCAGAAGGC